MKKSIFIRNNPAITGDESKVQGDKMLEISEDTDEDEECSDNGELQEANVFSFSGIIFNSFIILLVAAIAFKFVFPTIDSFQANMMHKKIGKSIVSNYFNLLQSTKYSEALKLLDVNNGEYSVDSLVKDLQNEFGTTELVDYHVLDVNQQKDYSVVNTSVSYIENGKTLTKDESFLVKNTPNGWKINLSGIIKKFKLEPVSATFANSFSITLDNIEYCTEGINLNLKIKNETYKKFNINGKISLNVNTGSSYSQPIQSVLKSKVCYNHNILFYGASGQPYEVLISLDGKDCKDRKLPVKIIN